MQLSAELSLYPLNSDYERIVLAFIDKLAENHGISAVTNSMSTQVHGDANAVLAVIGEALAASYAEFGKQVLVAKFIPGHQQSVGPDGDL